MTQPAIPPDARTIQRRYLALVVLAGLPLFALLVVLAVLEFQRQWRIALDTQRAVADERRIAVQAVVAAARAHVVAMESSIQTDLEAPWREAPRPAAFDLGLGERVLMLTRRPAKAQAERHGAIFGIPNEIGSREASRVELAAVDRLFLVQAAAHAASGLYRWSYYFSAAKDFVAIYPWETDQVMLAGGADRTAAFRGYFDYEVFTGALPARNLARRPYWTPVYVDAGGAGPMVSHAAPVDAGGNFRGIVGTDLVLTVFEDILTRAAEPAATLVLVDQKGQVVADSRRLTQGAKAVLAAADIVPAEAAAGATPLGAFAAIGTSEVLALPIDGAPWRLLHVVPRSEIMEKAARGVLPYGVILLGLVGTLLVSHLLLRRQFIDPVARLAGYVERESIAGPVAVPRLSGIWQPWVDRIAAAFARQRETIEHLNEAEQKTAAVIDVALDAIITADEEGRIVDFNPAAERMFGFPAEAVRGRAIADLIVPEQYREAHVAGIRRYRENHPWHVIGRRVELEALRADGKVFPIELQVHGLPRVRGTLFAAYIRDLTEAKARQHEIATQRERLHQAEKMTAMGSLLAGVAHELNNPLAVVIAQTTLLEEIVEEPSIRERARKIHAAADRCGRIVKTFIAMARQQAPIRAAVDLSEVVRAALEVTAYGLRSASVAVEAALDPALPRLDGDPDQLTQIVSNLLINAQQALAEQPEPRRIRIATAATAEGRVRLTVADNGPGVPADLHERIFEPYFTTKPAGVGTGIGLSVCRNIARAHGGTITLAERPGGGAEFVLDLPGGVAAHGAEAAGPAHRADGSLAILVVDDEPDVAGALAEMLQRLGHRPGVAATVEEALERIAAAEPDLVMSDLRMPGIGGVGLLRELRRRWPGLAGRFVFVTGDTVSGPPVIAAAGGDVVVLEKPFGRDKVAEAIRTVLARG